MDTDRDFLAQLSAVVRSLQDVEGEQRTLDSAVAAAPDVISGCDAAGVLFVRRSGFEAVAATHDVARTADALQAETGEGPAMDALRDHETVYSPTLQGHVRWRTWGPRVARELGIQSVVSYRLFTTKDTLGALNLYSCRSDAFDPDDIQNGLALAAHLAVALAAELRDGHLQTALTNRTVIGQAEGMLMERYGLSGDRAFEVLRRISSDLEMKLHQVAKWLVDTGSLPPPHESRRAPQPSPDRSVSRALRQVSAAGTTSEEPADSQS